MPTEPDKSWTKENNNKNPPNLAKLSPKLSMHLKLCKKTQTKHYPQLFSILVQGQRPFILATQTVSAVDYHVIPTLNKPAGRKHKM